MSFRQLDCFMEVAGRLSFTDAANALYLSQSAVSQQVKQLESALGFKLLVRDQKGIRLTEAGNFLFRRLQGLRADYQEAVGRAREIAEASASMLSVGYDGPMSEDWFARAAMGFHEVVPDVFLKLRKEPVSTLTRLLETDLLDLIVTHRTEIEGMSGICFHPLASGGCCLFVSADSPLAGKPSVAIQDLAGQHLLFDCEANEMRRPSKGIYRLEAAGIDFGEADAVPDGDVIFSMVEARLGAFVASHLCDAFACRYDVVSVDMDIDIEDALMGLAWKRDSPEIQAFVECAARLF